MKPVNIDECPCSQEIADQVDGDIFDIVDPAMPGDREPFGVVVATTLRWDMKKVLDRN